MAKDAKTVKPSFYEVIFNGTHEAVRGLLTGMDLMGASGQTVFFNYEAGVFHEGLGEKLAELVHLRRSDCHLIVECQGAAVDDHQDILRGRRVVGEEAELADGVVTVGLEKIDECG